MEKTPKISSQQPLPVEWNNTCDIVYVRKNIVFHEDEELNYYTYDEYKYNSRNFIEGYFEELRSDLDYISMMTEVDL